MQFQRLFLLQSSLNFQIAYKIISSAIQITVFQRCPLAIKASERSLKSNVVVFFFPESPARVNYSYFFFCINNKCKLHNRARLQTARGQHPTAHPPEVERTERGRMPPRCGTLFIPSPKMTLDTLMFKVRSHVLRPGHLQSKWPTVCHMGEDGHRVSSLNNFSLLNSVL